MTPTDGNDGDNPSASLVLHVDMDSFYVSAELLRRPGLRGKPVIVGGRGERGVVAAASYEARAYGVHSAMASVRALRMCPSAEVLVPDHAYYSAVSKKLRAIFEEFTSVIEPLALDEAFLDVTEAAARFGGPLAVGTELRRRVRLRLDLGCSVGVGTSKMVAKLASEAAKPSPGLDGPVPGRGVVVVEPGTESSFLAPHPVDALWGVGPATLRKLTALGIRTVADLAAVPRSAVVASLGAKHGEHLHALARAQDNRPVQTDRELKSVGHEETFLHDLHEVDELQPLLVGMVERVAARLGRAEKSCRTVHVKVRFADFQLITRSITPGTTIDSAADILAAARSLLDGIDATPGVRLLGVSVSGLVEETPARQLALDLDGLSAATMLTTPEIHPSDSRYSEQNV